MKSVLLSLICIQLFTGPLFAGDIREILVGSLQSWYSDAGAEIEVGRTFQVSDQQDGLRWPAQYEWQDTQVAKGLWIGTTNYTDATQYGGNTYSHKVVHMGPRVADIDNEFMPVEFKLIGKYDHPMVLVNSQSASTLAELEELDEINSELNCDRQIYNKVNTSIGVTMQRTISAWTHQENDNYFIYDYVFTNTGNVDADVDIEQSKTLKDVYFFFQYRYAPTRECGPYGVGDGYWLPQSAGWGASTMLDTRGENPDSGDLYRTVFSWLGKHSSWAGPGDNIGGPNYLGDGHLGAAQYLGVVTLHADKSASDKEDDPFQPKTTKYVDSDHLYNSGNSQFNATQMTGEYQFMNAGHPDTRFADAVGNGYVDAFGSAGGFSNVQGFGPYTLEPGESIHLVLAEAVAGLSREKVYEVGANWVTDSSPFQLPNGSTTSDCHEYKNSWVYTGRDSLFKTFGMATENFNSDYTLPSAPPPPEVFEVYSSNDHIKLYWNANAEDYLTFAGYSIYRAAGTKDTIFTKIFSCGLNSANPDIVNYYEDHDVVAETDYYYYIISFDNGSSNEGKPMLSSLFWTRTSKPAFLVDEPLIEADLYVSPTGDDNNSGLSAGEPLKTITIASKRILSNELHPHSIILSEGVYSPTTTGETFPVYLNNNFLTLAGTGKGSAIIDAGNSGNIIHAEGQEIWIKDLSMRNGGRAGEYTSGGAVYAENSTLCLENVTLYNNLAWKGGGIYLESSDVSLSGVSVFNNTAEKYGGGLYMDANSNVTFDESNRSSIYQNNSPEIGSDIMAPVGINPHQIILDTCTVLSPSDYFIFPSGKFSYDIQHSVFEQTNANLYVSPTGNDSYSGLNFSVALKTITQALKKIKADQDNPHTIFLSDGVYSNSENGEAFPIYPKNYTTLSGTSKNGTILDANREQNVIKSAYHTNVNLENLTIRNGSGRGIYSTYSQFNLDDTIIEENNGEGIFCADSSIFNLAGVTIRNNESSGLYVAGLSTVLFDADNRCNIYYNSPLANSGRDIVNYSPRINVVLDTFTVKYPFELYAILIDNFNFDILNGKIAQAEADLYVSPSGDDENNGLTEGQPLKTITHAMDLIFADESRPHTIYLAEGIYSVSGSGETFPITGREFVTLTGQSQENTILDGEQQYGLLEFIEKANISVEQLTIQNGYETKGGGMYCRASNPTLNYVTFFNDSASNGGAIYLEQNSEATLNHISFIENTATSNGGAIYCNQSDPIIGHTLFEGNYAGNIGGALYLSDSSPIVYNVTFYGNTTVYPLAGVLYYFVTDCEPVFINSIFRNNGESPIYAPHGTITFSHTNYEGGQENIMTGSSAVVNWMDGNIDSNPQFVGGDPFNYNLTESSPCVDAGVSFFEWNGDTLLNMHSSDYQGKRPDIGAFESVFTDIYPEQPPEIPKTFSLSQNYPNPFNPKTIINYELPITNYVELSIYNLLGQQVAKLVSEKQPAGRYKVEWDASGFASGVYLYRLLTNQGFIQTRKLVLLK